MSEELTTGEEIIKTGDPWILADGRTGSGWQLDIAGLVFKWSEEYGVWREAAPKFTGAGVMVETEAGSGDFVEWKIEDE